MRLRPYQIRLLILLGLAAFGACKTQCGKKRDREWKSQWLENTDSYNSKNSLITGDWSGNFTFAKNVNHNPYPQIDSSFTAKLSIDNGRVSGELTDSFGHAKITGVVNYPKVRLVKTYDLMSDETSMRRTDFGSVYYDGMFGEDNSVNGDWFMDPNDRTRWCGAWDMKRVAP